MARFAIAIVVARWLGAEFAVQGFDWDEVFLLASGAAAVGLIYDTTRRERRLEAYALDFEQRITRVETRQPDVELEARLRERVEERVAMQGERLAVLEERADQVEGRLAREFETAAELEARLTGDEDERE